MHHKSADRSDHRSKASDWGNFSQAENPFSLEVFTLLDLKSDSDEDSNRIKQASSLPKGLIF